MIEIKEKAKLFGLKAGKMKKADLIRAIQTAEGNHACFGNHNGDCDQTECCWRDDCMNT